MRLQGILQGNAVVCSVLMRIPSSVSRAVALFFASRGQVLRAVRFAFATPPIEKRMLLRIVSSYKVLSGVDNHELRTNYKVVKGPPTSARQWTVCVTARFDLVCQSLLGRRRTPSPSVSFLHPIDRSALARNLGRAWHREHMQHVVHMLSRVCQSRAEFISNNRSWVGNVARMSKWSHWDVVGSMPYSLF